MMTRTITATVAVLAAAGAVVLGWPAVAEFLAVDRCLDAGGSFNYAIGQCDFQANHPGASLWDRYSVQLVAAMICVIVAAVTVILRTLRSNRVLESDARQEPPRAPQH